MRGKGWSLRLRGAGICINSAALADEIQFTTLPQEVQTTVVPQTHIANPPYDQVQKDLPRYQLLEKKGRKEGYLDRKTGQKVTVKREKD